VVREETKAGSKFNHKNLAALQTTGHKLIMWTGNAEQAVPEQQYLGYSENLQKAFGSSFHRFFVIPGLHHCSGGEGAPTDHVMKLLEAAEDWVEKGKAPDSVQLSNEYRTFRVCAYPQRSMFKGGLDNPEKLAVRDARNWRCER